jgi:hypothetical protein
VNAAINTYAPSNENNTAAYQAFVDAKLGIAGSTPLSSLNQSQFQNLMNAIISYEGWSPGIDGWSSGN